jgi:hypothetical protein
MLAGGAVFPVRARQFRTFQPQIESAAMSSGRPEDRPDADASRPEARACKGAGREHCRGARPQPRRNGGGGQ